MQVVGLWMVYHSNKQYGRTRSMCRINATKYALFYRRKHYTMGYIMVLYPLTHGSTISGMGYFYRKYNKGTPGCGGMT